MKRCIAILLVLISALSLTACGREKSHEIQIVIPAGSQASYVYSEEEISPRGNTIKVSAGNGFVDTNIILKPIEGTEETYEPTYLAQDTPVEIEAEEGGWYKIGVAMRSVSDIDITVCVEVEDVDVRIE